MNVLWRLQNGESSRIDAKSVVLHVGANDIDRYIPSDVRTSDDGDEKERARRIAVAADRVANATQAAAMQILKVFQTLASLYMCCVLCCTNRIAKTPKLCMRLTLSLPLCSPTAMSPCLSWA